MVSRITPSAITSPAITPCTLTTSYFPVRGRESASRLPALAYLLPNNCAIFRAGICDHTLTPVASSAIRRASIGDTAVEWSEGLNPGVGVTWSAGPSFQVYRMADRCAWGAGKGVGVLHFASTPAEGLTIGALFVGAAPRPSELGSELLSSFREQVQPLAAIAAAFKGRTAAGRLGWFGSVLFRADFWTVVAAVVAASTASRRWGNWRSIGGFFSVGDIARLLPGRQMP